MYIDYNKLSRYRSFFRYQINTYGRACSVNESLYTKNVLLLSFIYTETLEKWRRRECILILNTDNNFFVKLYKSVRFFTNFRCYRYWRNEIYMLPAEVVARRCSLKKLFLKSAQHSLENTTFLILKNFKNSFFHKTSSVAASVPDI